MRIARDREARQRSCAEQHGWPAPSSAPSIRRLPSTRRLPLPVLAGEGPMVPRACGLRVLRFMRGSEVTSYELRVRGASLRST
eukprot:3547402-Prymnesium_polylepis.1